MGKIIKITYWGNQWIGVKSKSGLCSKCQEKRDMANQRYCKDCRKKYAKLRSMKLNEEIVSPDEKNII